MKIKLFNGLIIVDILTILLIFGLIFIPSSLVRIILGLPFIFFFPGYTLLAALFINKDEMDNIELLALSTGMSIAIVALIGFILNYTSLGITLESVLYVIADFIVLCSIVAFIRGYILARNRKLTMELNLRLAGWEGKKLDKYLQISLAIFIVGAIGVLGYTFSTPRADQTFSEFYILGHNGKAEDYPSEFTMKNGKVAFIKYDAGENDSTSGLGQVTMGIVNNQQQKEGYTVKMMIDDKPVNLNYQGKTVNQVGPIELQQGEKWEKEIGFAPEHLGDNQKVEFLLFKGIDSTLENFLHLRINVR